MHLTYMERYFQAELVRMYLDDNDNKTTTAHMEILGSAKWKGDDYLPIYKVTTL